MQSDDNSSPFTRRPLLSPSKTILAIFFFQALSNGGLYPRIPDIQQALGISEGALGLALMGQPVGALVIFLFSSRMIEKFGPKAVLMVALPMLALGNLLFAIVPNLTTITILFAAFGATFALSNVAMNVEADRVEHASGGRVMTRCHGMWSLGFLAASMIGVAARGFEISTFWHFAAILPVIVAASLIIIKPMTSSGERAHSGGAKKRITLPTLGTLALVGFGLSGVMVENGTRAWSVIYMRDTFEAAAWVDTLTLPAFMVSMSVMRLFSDGLIVRWGAIRIATSFLLIALVGELFVIFAQDLWQALTGFALLGIGISVIFPLSISAAARLGDRPASENVAGFTMGMGLVMLVVPGLMGSVAEGFGIRVSFGIILPMILISLLLVHQVAPKR